MWRIPFSNLVKTRLFIHEDFEFSSQRMQFTLEFISLLLKGIYLFLPLLFFFILIIIVMGQVTGRIEGWGRFDSLYWSFITALTIGYGDMKPLKKSGRVLSVVIGMTGIMFTGIIVSITVFAATKAFEIHIEPGLNLSIYYPQFLLPGKAEDVEGDSSVIYRFKMSHGKNKRNFQVFSPLELREIEKRAVENEADENSKIIDIRNYRPKRIPQLMWRECIKKAWEVDPLTCPKCSGEMRIIIFIYKKTVTKKILTHLNIYEEKKNPRAPPRAAPEYSEPPEVVHTMTAGPDMMNRFSIFKNSMTAKGCVCPKLAEIAVRRQLIARMF